MIPKNTWNQIMMHHDTHADALLADRTGAIAIAQLAGWEIDPAANLLMFCACAPCLFAPEPQLLIVPFTSGRDNALAMRAMADTRSDVVMVVVTPNREVRFGLVLLGDDRAIQWVYRIWSPVADSPHWLAAELGADPSYALRSQRIVKHVAPPWKNDAERTRGFTEGDRLLSHASPYGEV
jgi:hypothetical protein